MLRRVLVLLRSGGGAVLPVVPRESVTPPVAAAVVGWVRVAAASAAVAPVRRWARLGGVRVDVTGCRPVRRVVPRGLVLVGVVVEGSAVVAEIVPRALRGRDRSRWSASGDSSGAKVCVPALPWRLQLGYLGRAPVRCEGGRIVGIRLGHEGGPDFGLAPALRADRLLV